MLDGKIISTIKKNTKQVIEKMTTLETNVRNLSNNFNIWKDYWTSNRANKLDNLDKSLSGVESNLESKIDRLGSASSQSGGNVTIALGNLSNKIDALKQDVGTKSSQTTVNKVGQDLNNIASTITSKIGTVESKVNQTNTTLESMDNSIDIIVVKATESRDYAQGIHSIVSKGVIKRVQRGIIDFLGTNSLIITKTIFKENSTEYTVRSFTVTLPYSVDINKSIATCEWARFSVYNQPYLEGVNCQLTGNNKIIFNIVFNELHDASLKWMALYNISWQVVEYY